MIQADQFVYKPVEKVSEQAQVRTPYTPLFWGRSRSRHDIGCKIIVLHDKDSLILSPVSPRNWITPLHKIAA